MVTAYTLFLASLVLVSGSLGDHFGHRRVFCIGIALFAAPHPVSGADLFSRGVNEILFPVGCALVLFSARSLGNKVMSGV